MTQNTLVKSLSLVVFIFSFCASLQLSAVSIFDDQELLEGELSAQQRYDADVWERNRLIKRLIRGVEAFKLQLEQEHEDFYTVCQDIDIRTANLETMVQTMQYQLDYVIDQLSHQETKNVHRFSLERNVADMVEQLDRFDDILYEMSVSDTFVRRQLEILVSEFTQLVSLFEEISNE